MKEREIFYTIFSKLYVAAECNPLPLQELCRGKIRHYLRQNIWREHPELETEKPLCNLPVQRQTTQPRTFRRFVIPIFEESDEALTDDEQEIGQARFLLNARLADPGEGITRTLQLVRAIIQPNQNDSVEENQRVSSNVSEDTRDAAVTTNFHVRQQRRKSSAKNSASSTSTDGASDAGHSSTTVTADNDNNNEEEGSERDAGKSVTAYSNMSDSESDAEQENAFVQRKKIAKREKTDSGIVDDMTFSNEDGSSSSTNTNHSDSDITDTTDAGDAMDVELPDVIFNSSRSTSGSRSTSKDSTSRKTATVVHFVDSNAFAVYMREKIQQLPLPFSIKLYMNYNRKL